VYGSSLSSNLGCYNNKAPPPQDAFIELCRLVSAKMIAGDRAALIALIPGLVSISNFDYPQKLGFFLFRGSLPRASFVAMWEVSVFEGNRCGQNDPKCPQSFKLKESW
jgi:hypothetical protein